MTQMFYIRTTHACVLLFTVYAHPFFPYFCRTLWCHAIHDVTYTEEKLKDEESQIIILCLYYFNSVI